MTQQSLSLLAVALAAGWIGWRLWRWARIRFRSDKGGNQGGGCGGGCNCGHG